MSDVIQEADALARRRAVDPTVSCVVEAPAGSGKTSLLIQRLLNLLTTVEQPEEILAITFTTKAAQEMRHRLLKCLVEAANNTPVQNDHDQQMRACALRVLEHDQRRGWDLIRHPSRLMIKTIDGFCRQLVAQIPLASKSAALSIVPDPTKAYDQAALAVLDQLRASSPTDAPALELMRLIRNRAHTFRDLSQVMLAKRSQWLTQTNPDDPVALYSTLNECLLSLQSYALRRLQQVLPQSLVDPIVRLQAARAPSMAPLAWPATLEFKTAQLPIWRQFCDVVLTQGGLFKKSFTKKQGYEDEKETAALMKEAVGHLIDADERCGGAMLKALHALQVIPVGLYPQESFQTLVPILKTLHAAAAELDRLFIELGQVDFEHISMAALVALGAEEHPEELLLRLDLRLRHVLVDEFQDTSQSQWSLLNRLVSGFEPGDGRTLFLVGDPMQSIYGFREAQVGLFLSVAHRPIGQIRLESLQLKKNFRSQGQLVTWFNRTFSTILSHADDEVIGRVRYRVAEATEPALAGNAIDAAWFQAPTRQLEWEYATARIIEALEADERSTVAVLAPTRDSLRGLALALTRLGIEYEGVNLVPLAERGLIGDLLALTRAIVAPLDEVALLAVLRAPWCGLNLAELEQLAAHGQSVASLFADGRAELALSNHPSVAARIRPIVQIVAQARLEHGALELAVAVERAFTALRGPQLLADPRELDDAYAYFAALHQWQSAGHLTLEDFARGLNNLYSQVKPDQPRVTLLTIHAAKGLEWDTVLVLGLGKRPAGETQQWLVWQSLVNDAGQRQSLLAPYVGRGVQSDLLQCIRDLNSERLIAERERLWYVACTRARQRLILLGTTDPRDKAAEEVEPIANTGLDLLWPALQEDFRARINPTPARTVSRHAFESPLSARSIERVKDPLTPDPLAAQSAVVMNVVHDVNPDVFDFEWVSPAARSVGIVVHEIFEHLSRGRYALSSLSSLDPQWIQVRLSELGVFDQQLHEACARVRASVGAIETDPNAQWVFDATHQDVRAEWELVRATAFGLETIRIDRAFIDRNGVRWIIDFKTSSHEGEGIAAFLEAERARYQAQLDRYADWVKALEPTRPVATALYFPLLRRLLTVHAPSDAAHRQ